MGLRRGRRGERSIHRAPWPSAAEFAGGAGGPEAGAAFDAACAFLDAVRRAKSASGATVGRQLARLRVEASPRTASTSSGRASPTSRRPRGRRARSSSPREGMEDGVFEVTEIVLAEKPPKPAERLMDRAGALAAALAARGGPRLPAVEWPASIVSTNDRLKALARGGAPEWTVVLADEQTGGRGREGRTWVSPPGGLYLSVLLRPRFAEVGLLPLAAGLAVAEAAGELGVRDRAQVAERRARLGPQARRRSCPRRPRARRASSGWCSASASTSPLDAAAAARGDPRLGDVPRRRGRPATRAFPRWRRRSSRGSPSATMR